MFHNESFLKRFFRKMESRNYINGYLENVAQCVIKKKGGAMFMMWYANEYGWCSHHHLDEIWKRVRVVLRPSPPPSSLETRDFYSFFFLQTKRNIFDIPEYHLKSPNFWYNANNTGLWIIFDFNLKKKILISKILASFNR